MSLTEALHYDMAWWQREAIRQHAIIRLIPYETIIDDDIV